MLRDGWSLEDIKWEIEFLKKNNVNMDMTNKEMKTAYFPMIRKGSKKRINRKGKVIVLLTLQNAMNHATACS